MQWRTAPGGRGIPIDGNVGVDGRDSENLADLTASIMDGGIRDDDDPFANWGCGEFTVLGVDLALDGYVT